MYTPSVMNPGSPSSLVGAMGGWIVITLLLAACSPPPPCPPEEDRFDPEIALGDALEGEEFGASVMDAICTGGLTVREWEELAETSPGYEPVLLDCVRNTCVDAFEYETVCTLDALLTAWRDVSCPDCLIQFVDGDPSYGTKFVQCVP